MFKIIKIFKECWKQNNMSCCDKMFFYNFKWFCEFYESDDFKTIDWIGPLNLKKQKKKWIEYIIGGK